jgi:hypothetical protein
MTMSDVAGEFESERGPAEVWAVAEAVYDESQNKLVILFGSSLRLLDPDHPDEVFTTEWLPERDILRKIIPMERAYEYAQELFGAWTIKVRRSIPKSLQRTLEKAR